MKNFLAYGNLNLEEKDSLSKIIKSSSEVNDCSITNVLEDNSNSIWISTEELPQEIIINLSHSFLKEYPIKLTAIGIYCWHAYPSNPKLVEILVSKNNDNNFISFGNFDLCLKPGRQLLQLDEENDTNFLITENNNFFIKIIIKETYGDKKTYINNIYLYENIDFISNGKINNTIETIKEEDDSSSVFYLRESRERTLPRKNNNNLSLGGNNASNLYNSNRINNNQNIVIKVNDEFYSKDLTIDEFEIITKTRDKDKDKEKYKDNKLKEKNSKNKNDINDFNINHTYDNDESNIHTNNNLLGNENQFNGTYSEFSEKNNNELKKDNLTNKNLLLTKTNDNIDDNFDNNSNKNILNDKPEIEEEKEKKGNIKNSKNLKKNSNTDGSFDASLSSEDLESLELLKGTKTHQKNFFKPPKISDVNGELDYNEFQHSTNEFKFNTKNDILTKKFTENYFSLKNSNMKSKNTNSNISKNSNIISQKSKHNTINDINKNNNNNDDNNTINNNNDEYINELKEEMALLKNEFKNYKKEQEEINKQNQNKIIALESHIKKLQINSNKMNDVVKTLLEAQYIQNQTNNDYLLGQMRKIASETFVNIFSNLSQLACMVPNPSPTITIQNPNQNKQTLFPYNENGINMNYNDERQRQQTYQTTRRKMFSIDKINNQQNNYSINNNINNNIINNNTNNGINNVYNKKINDDFNFSTKANKLKKYNSGRNIVLKKKYMNQNLNNYINFDNQNSYNNNETIENTDNIEEEQRKDNLFYQTGYPTEINNPFKKATKINNINPNEILKINNNFNNKISFNKREIIHKRIASNTYKKKTFSPNKRTKYSYVIYSDSSKIFPETTVNASNQNKNINFNLNSNENMQKKENEENEEEEEASSNDDAPLKVSQLKTEKRNYNIDKIIQNSKKNFDEEKENDKDNEDKTNSLVGDTFTHFRNRLGEKLNEEIKKSSMIKKGKYSMENLKNNINENNKNVNKEEKITNIKKKKNGVKNDTLIRLIHQYNTNKEKNKENKNE